MNTAANVHEQNSSPIDKKEIKTGRRSGLIAIHVRPGGDVSKWPSTVEFKASDGGTYFIYWHPGFPSCKFVTVPSAKEVLPLTDVYGENDLVVIPSREGEWITEPNEFFNFYPELFEKVNVSRLEIPFMKSSLSSQRNEIFYEMLHSSL